MSRGRSTRATERRALGSTARAAAPSATRPKAMAPGSIDRRAKAIQRNADPKIDAARTSCPQSNNRKSPVSVPSTDSEIERRAFSATSEALSGGCEFRYADVCWQSWITLTKGSPPLMTITPAGGGHGLVPRCTPSVRLPEQDTALGQRANR